jgi:ATP-dependent DNA helicase RecQ
LASNYHEDNCENCDNCLHPKEQFEGKDALVNLIKVIIEVKEKFKADHVINILCGTVNVPIKSYKHHELELFGCGDDKDEKYWNAVIRQALVANYLSKDIENYGLLKMTEKGYAYLQNPESFMITLGP